MKERAISACCGVVVLLESIWLNVKRADGTQGRREIATVNRCSDLKCGKLIGDAHSIRAPKLSSLEWADLLQTAGKPPFYFNENNGRLLPEGMDLMAFEAKKVLTPGRILTAAPQDRAANDVEEQEYLG